MKKTFFVLMLTVTNFFVGQTHAATAKFSVQAIVKSPQNILGNQIITVQYKITNNTKITRTLTTTPITGITQTQAANLCSAPFTLASGQSCLLNLQINAAQLNGGVHNGPIICKTKNANDTSPDPLLCSQASNTDKLDITVQPCTGSLCLNTQKADRIQAVTAQYMQQYQIPGILVGIWSPIQGDYVIQRGFADLLTSRPISTVDHFHIASITKSFTTTVIMQLAQEGLLDLNAPISSLGFSIQNNNATVGQLADMRSGIFNYSADNDFLQYLDSHPLKKWQPQELVNYANSNPVYFAPGSDWHYSNTNTIILGMIIEQITGNPAQDEIYKRILLPLGLTETSYANSTALPSPYSKGYYGSQLEDVTTEIDPSFSGDAGAMISTLSDLKKWSQALAMGTLLTPTMQATRVISIQPMTFNPCPDNDPSRPHPSCPEYDEYGYGLGTIDGWRGHTGDYFGYTLLMMYQPNTGESIVIMVNLSNVSTHIPTDLFRQYVSILNS